MNNSKINGNGNMVVQADNIIFNLNEQASVKIDKYMCKLIYEAASDEENPQIFYIKTLCGRSIQCGSGKFSISEGNITQREMIYWEDALDKLIKYGFIKDTGYKGELFSVTRKGYELFDKIKEENTKNKE